MKSNTRILLAAPAALLLAGIGIYAQTPAKAPEGNGGAPPVVVIGPAGPDGSSGSITVRAGAAGPGGAPVPGIGASPSLTITGSASAEELPAPGVGEPPPPIPTPIPIPPPPPTGAAPQALPNGSGTIELRTGGMQPPSIQGTWIVRPGDTLYNIQRQTGIPMTTLLRLNGLTGNSTLRAGQILKTTGRIEEPRRYSTSGSADTNPLMANPLPGPEARIIESPAAILPPRSGHDIIRETKLKVLQRHYESALSDSMEMERSLITAPPDQKEELSGKAKALREFVTKLEADIEKLSVPDIRTTTGKGYMLHAPDGSGHIEALPPPSATVRPVDPADASPSPDSSLPPPSPPPPSR